MRTRRSFLRGLSLCAALAAVSASAQRTARVPRIALVFRTVPLAEMAGPDPINPTARAFVHAFRDAGLVDGQNVVIERRSAEGQGPERLAALMEEVVALGVDVIVVQGTAVIAAQRATDRIPIVGVVDNVLDTSLVESLSRPGRNVTGVGISDPAAYGKDLQLLKEAAPAISRVAVLALRPPPGPRASWRVAIDAAGRSLRVDVLWLPVDGAEDLEAAFATILRERADALDVISNHINYANRRRIAEFAVQQRLPSIGFSEDGMLLQYDSDDEEGMRRVAAQVKQILGGAKPGDLPFEQPTKFVLTINLKTANAIGLTIPHSFLLRADRIIR